MTRKLLAALLGVSAVLLGLERVGAFRFAGGVDTGFSARALKVGQISGLELVADAGRLDCWIQLQLRIGGNGVLGACTAEVNGRPLEVHSTLVAPGLHEVAFFARDPATGERAVFDWLPGIPIAVRVAAPAGSSLDVDDWHVYVSDGECDSRRKNERRAAWTVVAWFALVVTTAATILLALVSDEDDVISPHVLVLQVIAGVKDRDRRTTREMRALLKRVLIEGTPLEDAVAVVQLPTEQKRRLLWFRASASFLGRWTRLRSIVERGFDGLVDEA